VVDYISVAEARQMDGLRMVLTPGLPAPWTVSIKNIFEVKNLEYTPVLQEIGGENRDLIEWTAQATAPVAIWNDEPPRCTWIEQLYLAERLAPNPPLIPEDSDDRKLMFGFCNELMGENGLIWNRRLRMVDVLRIKPEYAPDGAGIGEYLAAKYHYDPSQAEEANRRVVEILEDLAEQLARQKAAGSKFLIGDSLSALDLYWAGTVSCFNPLAEDVCPMPPMLRTLYEDVSPEMEVAVTPELLAHRDFIYKSYLTLPMDH
jgi:glutathione S-transferase